MDQKMVPRAKKDGIINRTSTVLLSAGETFLQLLWWMWGVSERQASSGSPSDTELNKLAHKIPHCWDDLVIELGVPIGDVINSVDHIFPHQSPVQKARFALVNWRECFGSEATYEKLADALEKVGHPDLADEFGTDHMDQKVSERQASSAPPATPAANSGGGPREPKRIKTSDPRRFHDRHKQFVGEGKDEKRSDSGLYDGRNTALSGKAPIFDDKFMRKLTVFSQSVGIIIGKSEDGRCETGTVFRVGYDCAMTNWHVAQNVLKFFTRCRESVTVSFNYCSSDRQAEDLVELYLHPDRPVIWSSPVEELDAAVLQLDTQRMPLGYQLPSALGHLHGDASCSSRLYIVAHDRYSGRYNRVIDPVCPVVKWDTLPREMVVDHCLSDPRKTLLNSGLREGSSGSPGFDEHARLVVMYTKGIPNAVNPKVKQAVNIRAIREQMVSELAQLLFPEAMET